MKKPTYRKDLPRVFICMFLYENYLVYFNQNNSNIKGKLVEAQVELFKLRRHKSHEYLLQDYQDELNYWFRAETKWSMQEYYDYIKEVKESNDFPKLHKALRRDITRIVNKGLPERCKHE